MEFHLHRWLLFTLTIVLAMPLMMGMVEARTECLDEVQLCLDACLVIPEGGEYQCGRWVGGVDRPYVHCALEDIVECPREWDPWRWMWLGGCLDGRCYGPDEGDPGEIPEYDCISGYEQCGTGEFEDPDGDVFRCVDGFWQLEETCDSDEYCEEITFSHAECRPESFWYCPGTLDCYLRYDYHVGCYETQELCEASIPIFCLNDESGTCVERTGECLPHERPFRGTDMTIERCQSYWQDPAIFGGLMDLLNRLGDQIGIGQIGTYIRTFGLIVFIVIIGIIAMIVVPIGLLFIYTVVKLIRGIFRI